MAKKERMVVKGNRLAEVVSELVSRGDSRRVCLINEGKHLLDIPITTGDPASPASAIEAPVLATIRAFGMGFMSKIVQIVGKNVYARTVFFPNPTKKDKKRELSHSLFLFSENMIYQLG